MIGRILLSLAAFALAGFVVLTLIGLWDRYEQETKELGFSGLYERYLASQAGFADDPKAHRAVVEAERAQTTGVGETAARIASAQVYPTRPVRIIVGDPPGGTSDIVARLIGQLLSERLGQPFVVENQPGAGTNVATEAVVKAAPDGYTLLVVDAAPAINATLYRNLNFVFLPDIAPVACVISTPLFMEVNLAVPAKTVPEFIAYAKANARKVKMGSNGNGALLHLAGELFKMMTGVEMVHVPYRGAAPALTDLMSGQVQVMFVASIIEHIKAGKVRPLAVTTATRSEVLPDIPALSEFLPGYDVAAWNGVGAPKNTPPEIIDKLNKEINAVLADPKLKVALAELGSRVVGGSPADFGKLIADETEKWGKVIRAANIKAD